MKKVFLSVLVVVFAFLLVGCNKTEKYEIAMVTDYGDITDQSFNQTTWEACQEYAKDNNKSCAYYKPAGDSTAERVAKIEQAIDKGAKVVVMPGFAFAGAVAEVQDEYPDVKFIAEDVTEGDVLNEFYTDDTKFKPEDQKVLKDPNNKPHLGKNVACVIFREEQAGYLAGYAAVKEGLYNLGFLGGMAVPAVVRFGYGYLQGIADASKELKKEINLWYIYGGTFGPDPKVQGVMEQWSADGCNTVFASGGGIFLSLVSAFKGKENHQMIGVDIDQSKIVKDIPVVTSATKGLREVTKTCLDEFYGDWKIGGKQVTYGISKEDPKEYVGLPRDTWTMKNFTTAEYDKLLGEIREGKRVIDGAIDVKLIDYVKQFENITVKNEANFAGQII